MHKTEMVCLANLRTISGSVVKISISLPCKVFELRYYPAHAVVSRIFAKKRSSETEDQEKQRLATLNRLKRGDENELESKLRLECYYMLEQL